MQERRLRLGDILDDYCPRERRLTNHAVVAMIGDQVKQTRCTTCDTEHPYKGAKVPPRRLKKDAPGALYEEVLAGKETGRLTRSSREATADDPPADTAAPADTLPSPPATTAPPERATPEPQPPTESPVADDGPVHRPLIRATLPRPEGQPPARPLPEFTIRQTPGRNGNPREARRARRGGRPPDTGRPSSQGDRVTPARPGKPGGTTGGRPPFFSHRSGLHTPDRSHSPAGPPRHGHPRRYGKPRSK